MGRSARPHTTGPGTWTCDPESSVRESSRGGGGGGSGEGQSVGRQGTPLAHFSWRERGVPVISALAEMGTNTCTTTATIAVKVSSKINLFPSQHCQASSGLQRPQSQRCVWRSGACIASVAVRNRHEYGS
ncbi:hypothetical protein O3P69_014248 [Scylla paramamosain]|uniref:Uncharacterized protein n=1 Tax=Scylla paramamosain TaxID=85552 RepID=A0AAW0TB14_SCYPA